MVVAKNADALKKHLKCFNKTKQKSSSTATMTSSSTSSSTSSITPNTDQSSVYDYVTNDDKLKTEIIWVLKCVLAVYSNRSCDGLDEIFARMFPDSAIAQTFKLGRQKSMYLVTYGIAPYYKSLLKSQLAKSDIMIFSFYESLNSITQNCEMDVILLFCVIGLMKVRKLKSSISC